MAILVMGMHRSGTSMIMRLLNLCGVYVGDDLLGAGPGNPTGYWEDRELVHLNQDLLASMGGHTFGPPAYREPPDPLRHRAQRLIARLSAGGEPWGMKDPRLCLLTPLWAGLLPDARAVLCVRHPLEAAASLEAQNKVPISLGLSLWYEYNLRALAHAGPLMVTHYGSYLERPAAELGRVLGFLGLPYYEEMLAGGRAFIDPGLRHFQADAGDVPDSSRELYGRLCEMAEVDYG